jgi:hypothetical protein
MRDLLKTTWPKAIAIGLTFVFFVTGSPRSSAQAKATNQPWAYQLLEVTRD